MNRNIDYIIDEDSAGLRVEQFLRRKRYSGQNLSEIKRMPKSILVNGVHYYMRHELSKGDHLQVRICETKNSEKIPPPNQLSIAFLRIRSLTSTLPPLYSKGDMPYSANERSPLYS